MTQTMLVTGCSTGLGRCVALQAAESGMTVYATMRDLSGQAALKAAAAEACTSIEVRRLDVTDTGSIDASVSEIVEKHGVIDVLVNNAGIGFARSLEQASEREIQNIMDINFMGVARCTKAVLPHMRKARSGRVVNISSVGGLSGQPFNEIYCASKFAVEGFTEALATYVGPAFGIHFTAIEPGGIASEFANSILAHIMESGGIFDDEYRPLLEKYIADAEARGAAAANDPEQSVYQTPDEVARIVIQCVEAEDPPVRIRTSDWAEELCALKTAQDPDGKKLREKVVNMFMGGFEFLAAR